MHRATPWKPSLRSLLLAPLLAGLVPGCGDVGQAPPEPASPEHARAAPLTSAPTPKQLILEPEADTYVSSTNPAMNFGKAENLVIDSSTGEVYLRFNLSGIPAGAHIASVMLQALAHDGYAYGGDGSVYAYSLKQGRSRGWRRRAPPLPRRWRSRGRSAHPVWTGPGCCAGRKALDVFACLRCGGRLKGVGVREGSRRGESDCGAPGVAHGECAPGPCARAAPERVVLKLKPPQPAKRARHLPRPSWESGWAGQACVCWR